MLRHREVHFAAIAFFLLPPLLLSARAADTDLHSLLASSERVVFLGDSITFGGQYIAYFDAWMMTQPLDSRPHVIDAGLPSETVSGLSEEGHAGGKFPRPDLHERLQRVLQATKPDLVISCYGINCGIYQPLDEQRFAKYRQGYQRLKDEVEAAGAKLVAVTPPFYDDQRRPLRGFSYNDVLGRYSDWLLSKRADGWAVIDLHGPMTDEMTARRKQDLQFHFQGDGVHPNDAGHWFMAAQLIRAFGDAKAAACDTPAAMLALHEKPAAILPLAKKKMGLLRNAYVGAAGHKRPGVAKGLPIEQAEAEAAKLDEEMAKVADAAS
ncbi:MAG: SGNH/GDSL hydrolase family protein [Planctomycetales bacterium]|nr:SGNH/GDSL hydrolase family protein [Planctomycetales bacterium]